MAVLLVSVMALGIGGCGSTGKNNCGSSQNGTDAVSDMIGTSDGDWDMSNTIVYGSNDYTRINPAMDEHGEINALIFDGLTDHDGNNQVIPRLAKSWDYDESTFTYTFHLEEGVKWHDGEPFTADDVKFTIEAIMNPDNESENAPHCFGC